MKIALYKNSDGRNVILEANDFWENDDDYTRVSEIRVVNFSPIFGTDLKRRTERLHILQRLVNFLNKRRTLGDYQ